MNKFHPKCRPPRGATGLSRAEPPLGLNDQGRWVLDDGKASRVAFIGKLDDQNYVWVAPCTCHKTKTPSKCPRWKALEYSRERLDVYSISVQERPRKGGTRR